jgi:hypothetical protein
VLPVQGQGQDDSTDAGQQAERHVFDIVGTHAQGDEKLPFKAEAVDYGEDDKQRQEPMTTFADCLRCMNHVVCSILS